MRKKHFSLSAVPHRAVYGLCALILTLSLTLCSVLSFFVSAHNVRENVLRLHVIANSDSEADQAVKLLVRDEVLKVGADIFDGSVTAEEAEEKITPQLEKIEQAAKKVLKDNGFSYGVTAQTTREYFDVRTYEDVTLPAGKYTAVKIVLGNGEGQNWWCVMFPPLCLPAVTKQEDSAELFGEDGKKVVENSHEYEIRFKIAELFEKLFNKKIGR